MLIVFITVALPCPVYLCLREAERLTPAGNGAYHAGAPHSAPSQCSSLAFSFFCWLAAKKKTAIVPLPSFQDQNEGSEQVETSSRTAGAVTDHLITEKDWVLI